MQPLIRPRGAYAVLERLSGGQDANLTEDEARLWAGLGCGDVQPAQRFIHILGDGGMRLGLEKQGHRVVPNTCTRAESLLVLASLILPNPPEELVAAAALLLAGEEAWVL